MKKTIYKLTLVLTGVSVMLAMVIASSKFPEDVQYDFNRRIEDVITPLKAVDLIYNSFYIAGANNHNVYLASTEGAFTLITYSKDLENRRSTRLCIPAREQLYKNAIRVSVYDSTVFLSEGRSPRIYRGTINDSGIECLMERMRFDHLYFFNAVPVSGQSVLLQGVSKAPYKNILCKESHVDSSYRIVDNILKTQVDGLFCTTGTLKFDKHLNRAVFVYSHRNQYILLDTNLRMVDTGQTIDTFSTARVRSVDVESTNDRQLISPESQVNKYALVSQSRLFIVSGLYTTHDDMHLAKRSSVIDVYDLLTKQYCYSFYLPDHEGKKFSSIIISGNTLYAIYDHYLKAFSMKDPSREASGLHERYCPQLIHMNRHNVHQSLFRQVSD